MSKSRVPDLKGTFLVFLKTAVLIKGEKEEKLTKAIELENAKSRLESHLATSFPVLSPLF